MKKTIFLLIICGLFGSLVFAQDQILTLPDGSTYTGQVKGGKPHGNGTAAWLDGDKYTGQWKEARLHGNGHILFLMGDNIRVNLKTGQETEKVR